MRSQDDKRKNHGPRVALFLPREPTSEELQVLKGLFSPNGPCSSPEESCTFVEYAPRWVRTSDPRADQDVNACILRAIANDSDAVVGTIPLGENGRRAKEEKDAAK